MNRQHNVWAFVAIICALTSIAPAAIVEVEPNDTLATATFINRGTGNFADVGVANLGGTGGDVDVFSLDLLVGDLVLANTAGIEGVPIGSDPDTIISLIDSTGTIIEFDDDDAQSFGSNFTFEIATAGTYYIAVSGFGDSTGGVVGQAFGDTSFIGNHTESGRYILTLSVVPEPSALALLGVLSLSMLGIVRSRFLK